MRVRAVNFWLIAAVAGFLGLARPARAYETEVDASIAAQYYTLSNPGRIVILSEGRCDPSDGEASLRHMVPFCAAVFRAPAPSANALVFSRESLVNLAGVG